MILPAQLLVYVSVVNVLSKLWFGKHLVNALSYLFN